jgi:hypothetical protein
MTRGDFTSKDRKRMVSLADFKVTNMKEWKKYRRLSRSMDQDDFEMLQKDDDTSSSSED